MNLTEMVEFASDCYFMIENGEVIYTNSAAQKLLQHHQFELKKVLEVCEAKGCALHSVMANCHNCEVKENFDPRAFSLVLATKDGQQESFSASYNALGQGRYSLSIRNLTMQTKTDHLFQQKQLVAYVSQAHEKERKKMAQDLHDSLAQSVFSILLETRKVKRDSESEEGLLIKLAQIESQLVMTLEEIKTMALDLRPAALDDLGLASAISSLINRLEETTGIEINAFTHLKHDRFSEIIEITLFRVLQEALMNAIKYAKVESIEVLLVEQEGQLILDVIDQGVGFETDSPLIQGTGMGLLHMEERVQGIGGRLMIESTEEGTVVKVRVPIKEGEET